MKLKTFITLSALFLGAHSVQAQEPTGKLNVKIGGMINMAAYYDSYRFLSTRDGLLFYYPVAPDFNSSGEDLSKTGSTRFSIHSSRINVNISGIKVNNMDLSGYIETDFLGAGESYLQHLRLRHGYMELKNDRDEILIGQTNTLVAPIGFAPNTITAGAGMPFAVLNRSVQVRYGRRFGENTRLWAAAAMYVAHLPKGANRDQQANAGLPDLHAQMQFGNPNAFVWGFTAGGKALRPRTETDAEKKTNELVFSGDLSLFFQAKTAGKDVFKFQTIYGSNLSYLSMIGGYGRRLDDDSDDYGYTNTKTSSTWFDFESRSMNEWRVGLFSGYQSNLGSSERIDAQVKDYMRDTDITYAFRVAPRVTRAVGKHLLFGCEYMITGAKWGEKFDEYHTATASYETSISNRVTFLARFSF